MENNPTLIVKEKNGIVIKTGKLEPETRLYRKRWFILAMFMVFAIASGVQWMQYSIIGNFIMQFYQVEAYIVEWTAMFFMLSYVILTFPALWFLDKVGNRISMLVAAGGICVGSWIKMLAVRSDGFLYVMVGQAISASAATLTFGLAGSVTASWFGPREIASAGSLAVFGDLFGAGTGFLWPPLFVHRTENVEDIGRGLYNLCLTLTVFSSLVFILIFFFFKECPKKPPSNAQIVRNEQKKQANCFRDLVKMLSRKSLLLLLLTIGLHLSTFSCHATLLNRIFIFYFPGWYYSMYLYFYVAGSETITLLLRMALTSERWSFKGTIIRRQLSGHEKDGGIVGCLMILCGLVGVIFSGLFVDWTHLFKETTITFGIGSTLCMVAYTMALHSRNLFLVYVSVCSMGVFLWGYWSSALQLSFELVHPYSEGSAAGVALFTIQLMGLIVTPIYREIFERFDPLTANISLIVVLVVSILLSLKIPAKYRRQQVEHALKFGESAEGFLRK